MKNAFVKALESAASDDERIIIVTADIGYKMFDTFRERFKDRYINVGVAEAQMVGLAAGLAMTGWKSIIYTIGPFASIRPLEHIRNDICYQELPVVIVAAGGGYAYGPNGPTHHATDDLAVMRAMPGMTVVAPGDPWEVEQAFKAAILLRKPVYLRIGRVGEPKIDAIDNAFILGKARRLREGDDVSLFVIGGISAVALESSKYLEDDGISLAVEQMHTLKPLDTEAIDHACQKTHLIVTLEEHGFSGGLGSAVAEWCAKKATSVPLLSIHAPDRFIHESGSQDYLRKKCGLDSRSVANAIRTRLKEMEAS